MTPFGSMVEKNNGGTETFHSSKIDSIEYGDDTGTPNDAGTMKLGGAKSDLEQVDVDEDAAPFSSDFDIEVDKPMVDSDEEYVPNEEELKLSFRDDEHFLPDDDLAEPIEEVSMASKKMRIPKDKTVKKSKRIIQSVKDDGDDRTYKIRIR